MNKKNAIIVFLLVVYLILANPVNAVTCPTGTDDADSPGVCIPTDTGLSEADASEVIVNVMQWLLGILAAIAIVGFVISGIQYLLSGGDDKRMQAAKRNMIYCIIGVVIGLSGYIVITAIDTALKGASTAF
jgi:hypothetical protein